MNGADALIETFIDNGVTACFANPGASEMRSARRKRAGDPSLENPGAKP